MPIKKTLWQVRGLPHSYKVLEEKIFLEKITKVKKSRCSRQIRDHDRDFNSIFLNKNTQD